MTLIRDIADYLKFPFSTPAKPTTTVATTMFQDTITDSDLKTMVQRNQAAHGIVVDVAQDAVTGFKCLAPDETEQPLFNTEVQLIYAKYIARPLARALLHTRLYGHCGILIGYDTKDNLSTKAKPHTKIGYLQPIPKPWINEIVLNKDRDNNLVLPPSVDYYTLATQNNDKIDSTKIVHMYNPSIDEDTLEGESSLECIYDDLTILKSMDWGTGQAMWRSGGGLNVFIAPEGSDQEQLDGIHDSVTEINARTVLTMPPGTKMETARGMNMNPRPSYDVILQQIAFGTRIPISILMGTQAGTLTASEKDRKDYYELLDNIQKNILTPALTAILNKFQAAGQLLENEFIIEWDKTPVWEIEERKAKLYIAQAEHHKATAQREIAQAKLKELEYKEQLKRVDAEPK